MRGKLGTRSFRKISNCVKNRKQSLRSGRVDSPVNGEFKPEFSVVQFSLAMLNVGILF